MAGVEALRLVLRYVHLIGFALLLGGAVAQFVSGKFRINPAILWGSIIQLVSGIGLAAPLRGGGDDEPSPVKLGVKLVIAILIFIPFLVIDLVVGLSLASLGLQSTSPQTVALPLKLVLFVAVDGWRLLIDALLRGYA